MKRKNLSGLKSLLDTDFYIITMANAVLQKYPDVRVSYKFTDRRPEGRWTEEALQRLQDTIRAMSTLALTRGERAKCEAKFPWINRMFWDWLNKYRYDPSEVEASLDAQHNLQVRISGLLCRGIFWEVPLL